MFELTPLEARDTARKARAYFLRQRYRVRVERPAWPGAGYRPTLTCTRMGRMVLVEAQVDIDYHNTLKAFRDSLATERRYAELFLATGTAADSVIPIVTLSRLDDDGVGLIVVDERGAVSVSRQAMNWAYVVNPDPTLAFGRLRSEVEACFLKYNRHSRTDGMRDLCNIGERETRKVAQLALSKGWFITPRVINPPTEWAAIINLLASSNAVSPPHQPILDEPARNDLTGFKNGRNLVDHPAMNAREARSLAQQFQDRMLLGARMIAKLLRIKRQLSR